MVAGEVVVGVNEAGQDGGLRQVNDGGAVWDARGGHRHDLLDALSADDDHLVLQQPPTTHIQQAPRQDVGGFRLLGLYRARGEQEQQRRKSE